MKNKIKNFDLFQQGVSLRTTEESSTLPSWMGLFCTILVIIVSTVYLTLRLDILINRGDSNVIVLKSKNAFPSDTVQNITIGDELYDFRVMFSHWDLDTNIPLDKDRIGILGFYEVHDYWDDVANEQVKIDRKLPTHPCTFKDAIATGADSFFETVPD